MSGAISALIYGWSRCTLTPVPKNCLATQIHKTRGATHANTARSKETEALTPISSSNASGQSLNVYRPQPIDQSEYEPNVTSAHHGSYNETKSKLEFGVTRYRAGGKNRERRETAEP